MQLTLQNQRYFDNVPQMNGRWSVGYLCTILFCMKELIGAIAVILTFVGYIPYIRDTISGKTKPHIYTWFIWSFISFIAFALQITDHAGPGAFVTLAAAIACGAIFVLGFWYGEKRITILDTLFLLASLVATAIWLYAKQPVISIILLCYIDILGFFPTVRKSWNKPQEETLASYQLNTVRFGLGLLALQQYTIMSALYPATWLVANGAFSVFLIVRRKQLRKRMA